MKNLWITALQRDTRKVDLVLSIARHYGLDGNGHFWTDDLKNLAWQGAVDPLTKPDTGLWVILVAPEDLEPQSVRYGLSLLALAVQGKQGVGFPIFIINTQPDKDFGRLPTPLAGAKILSIEEETLGAKLVAKANMPVKKLPADYRMDIHANPGYGVWFELGPSTGGEWAGALCGVHGGEVTAHGVGPAGELPQKTVLEYQMKGLALAVGDEPFTAWAVKNHLDDQTSYYVQIKDTPQALVFGPLSEEDELDAHVLRF